MKHIAFFLLALSVLLFFSCKNTSNKSQTESCSKLSDKAFVMHMADSILKNAVNIETIWNLSELDSSIYFVVDDYFTNTQTKDRLIVIGGSAGISAGSADHLWLLVGCTGNTPVIWTGQMSEVTTKDILDVDNDGIKEIINYTGSVWMGECHDYYEIMNFKGNKKNVLYSASSFSFVDCGWENFSESINTNDTVEVQYTNELIKIGNTHVIRQTKSSKIYQGGDTDAEAIQKLKIVIDTATIELKKSF